MASRQARITKGSCWPCRRRRVKCNLQQPICERCREAEEACSYGPVAPVKWVGGMATRGHLAAVALPHQNHESSSIGCPNPTAQMDNEDLVLYFANAVLPRFQLGESSLQIDLDAIIQDEPFYHVVLAISLAHYALDSKIETNNQGWLRRNARQGAIGSFRKRLEAGVKSDEAAQHLFTINVLLCMLDGIIEPCDESNASVYHMRGGFAILEQWTQTTLRMLMQNGLQSHMLSVFATIDLVHAMLSGEKPFFHSTIWPMFAEVQAWWGQLHTGDRFLGILKAFSDMALLAQLVNSCGTAANVCSMMEKCLPDIQATLCSSKTLGPATISSDAASLHHWETFCTMYEICGTIFMQRALRNRPIDDETVQAATRKGVAKLLDDALPGMLGHCLILPILVIGCHCVHIQDRRAIMEALSPSMSYLSFGSLKLMTDFLRETWSSSDMARSWTDCFAKISGRVFLF